MYEPTDSAGHEPGGQERRRYPRHDLYLDAVLSGRQFRARPCKIRDFCLGGMYLAWDNDHRDYVPHLRTVITRGDLVVIEFAAEGQGGKRKVEVEVSIARVLDAGLGVAFLDPDPEAFRVLQGLAERFRHDPSRAAVGQRPGTHTSSAGGESFALARLLPKCKDVVARNVAGFVRNYFQQAGRHLFDRAQKAESMVEHRALLDAIPLIATRGKLAEPRVLAAIVNQMDRLGEPLGASCSSDRTEPAATLALVAKDELEDLLAGVEIVSKAEARFKGPLFEIEQRLSHLIRSKIDQANNPIGPSAICKAFFTALNELDLNGVQRTALYATLEESLMPGLSILYCEINDVLKASNVLPDLRREPFSRRPRPATPRRAPREPVSEATVDAGHPPSWASGDGGGRAHHVTYAPSQADEVYRAAQHLFGLHKGLGSPRFQDTSDVLPGGQSPEERLLPPIIDTLSPCYDRSDIVKALPMLQREYLTQRATQDFNVGDRLLAMLRGQHDGAEKLIGEPENQAIDMVGTLLASIKHDAQLSDIVKSQIRKLQIPLHRVALADPAFFSARSHPARQVVNRLAKLQPEGAACDLPEDQALHLVLDGLVDKIAARFDEGSGIFAEVLEDLDELGEDRIKAYEQNVARLMSECEEQQAFLKARRKDGRGGRLAPAVLQSPDAAPEIRNEWELWLARAKQLKVKDVISLKTGSGKLQSLGLAWVGEDYNPYVFVDSTGAKTASMTLQELAMLLRRGTATIVDPSELPVVDRALYGVLYKLHERIEHGALHDPLTGLMNRKKFIEELEQALHSTAQRQAQHVLAYVHLAGVDPIVATCGGKAKDQLLQKVAALFGPHVGDHGVIGRIGDVDFGVLLKDCSQEEGLHIAKAQLESLEKYCVKCKEEIFALVGSIGLVPITDSGTGVAALIQAAEASCLTAQESAGNHIHICHVDLDLGEDDARIDWQAWINKTLGSDRLELYGQRILPVKADGLAPLYCRLLMGIPGDSGKMLWTEDSLEGSEFSAKMQVLDRLVIRDGLCWMADHRDRVDEAGGYAITLSTHSLRDERLIDYVIEQFFESKMSPGKVCFEMTEAAVLDNLSRAERFVRTLKGIGCRFSVTRFGRTEVSHDYLHRLPVDYLKIDGRFIKELNSNQNDCVVVKSVAEIGHLLGKQIIADQVDDASILARLGEIGVDYAQGVGVEAPRLLEAVT